MNMLYAMEKVRHKPLSSDNCGCSLEKVLEGLEVVALQNFSEGKRCVATVYAHVLLGVAHRLSLLRCISFVANPRKDLSARIEDEHIRGVQHTLGPFVGRFRRDLSKF